MKEKKIRTPKQKRKLLIKRLIAALVIIAIPCVYFLISSAGGPAKIEDGEAKYSTYYKEVTGEGTPLDYTPYDNMGMILWQIEHQKNLKGITTGEAKSSGLTQVISETKVIDNDIIFLNALSDGVVKVAKQRYINMSTNQILRREGKIKDGVGVYDDSKAPEVVSKKAYLKAYGRMPNTAIGYILCEETFLEAPVFEQLNDNSFKLSLNLDPAEDKAPFNYKREIITNSGSTMIPIFNTINIDFTFDSLWQITSVDVRESYQVKVMGINAETNTDIHTEYTYGDGLIDDATSSYYKSYAHLKANEEEDVDDSLELTEAGNADILIGSLQNADGSAKLFNLKANALNNELQGKIALDISDTSNIKVYALVNGIYVEYSDLLYLKLGNAKLKGSIDSILALAKPLLGGSSNTSLEELDLNALLDKINEAELIKNDGVASFSTTLSLLGIDINLTAKFNIVGEDDYRIISLEANVIIDGNQIDLKLESTEDAFEIMSHDGFQAISNLQYVVNNISTLINANALNVNLAGSLKDLYVEANALISIKNDVKAKINIQLAYGDILLPLEIIYSNDVIYFTYQNINLKISVNDLMSLLEKVGVELPQMTSEASLNIEDIVRLVLSIDFNEVIKTLELTPNNSKLVLELSTLTNLINSISLNITNANNGLNLAAVVDSLSFNASVVATNESVVVKEAKYQNLANLSYIIDGVFTIINEKHVSLSVNALYEGVKLNGNIYVDFNDTLKLLVDLNASYNNLNIPLTVYYPNDSYIYIHLFDNKLKLELPKANSGSNELDLNNILNRIFSLDFTSIIKNLELNENETILDIDLSSLIPNLKLLEELSLVLTNNGNFNLSVNDIVNIEVIEEVMPELPSFADYNDLEWLVSSVNELLAIVNNKKLSITLDGELNLTKLTAASPANDEEVVADKKLKISGGLKIDFKNDLIATGRLLVSLDSTSLELDLAYLDNYFYIELSGARIKFNSEDIASLIDYISEKFGIIVNKEDNQLDLSSINNVLETIKLQDNTLSIDLSSLVSVISIVVIKLETNLNLNATANVFNLNINVNGLNEDVSYNTDKTYVSVSEVIALIDNIYELKDIATKDTFNLNVDITLDEGRNNSIFDIVGSLYLHLPKTIDGKIDTTLLEASVDLKVIEKKDRVTVGSNDTHTIILRAVDEMLYVRYRNTDNEESYVQVKMSFNSIEALINSISNLIAKLIPNLGKSTSRAPQSFDLMSFINYLTISDNGDLSLGINLNNKVSKINFVFNDDAVLRLNAKDIYISNESVYSYTKLDINNISLTHDSQLVEALDGIFNDLSSLDKLVDGIISLLDFETFKISGVITLNAVISINIPVNVIINVEDKKPSIYIHLDMSNLGLGAALITKKNIYIYIDNGYAIIKKVEGSNTSELKITLDSFFADLTYYLLDFGIGMPRYIMDQINKPSTSTPEVDAGQTITKEFNFENNTFSFGLNMGAITGNSSLGNLEAGIKLEPYVDGKGNNRYFLKEISSFKFTAVSIVNISLTSPLAIQNIGLDKENNFGVIDKVYYNEQSDYIKSYSYPLYDVYKNKKFEYSITYNITLVSNYGIEDRTISGKPNQLADLYEIKYTSFEGKNYKLVGWYTDTEFTNEFNGLFGNENLVVYAKWEEIFIDIVVEDTIYENVGFDFVSRLEKDYYYLSLDKVFYGYHKENLTIDVIFSYIDCISYEDNNIIITLYSLLPDNYYKIELEYDKHFSDLAYDSICLENGTELSSALLPNKEHNNLVINYWYDENGNEITLDKLATVSSNNKLTAVYASYNIFRYEVVGNNAKISEYSYTGSAAIKLIFPKYYYINEEAYIVTDVGSYYQGKKNIGAVYFTDAITSIPSKLFYNVSSLKEVYLSSTITSVADDAFQMTSDANAKALRIYSNQSIIELVGQSLLGYHKPKTFISKEEKRYYGKEYANSFVLDERSMNQIINSIKF